MHRLFVALELPESVRDHLLDLVGGLPGARWNIGDQLHMTLRFVGDVDGSLARDIHAALARIEHDAFEIALEGVGFFPPRGTPKQLWVGVTPSAELTALRDKVESRLVRAGLEPEHRKWHPHVTLARLQGAPSNRIGRFLTKHALFKTEPFGATSFALVRSHLLDDGAHYATEHSWDLMGGVFFEDAEGW